MRRAVLLLTVLAGACAISTVEPRTAAADKVPAATPDGEPVSCIPLTSIRESHVRSDRVIDFIANGNRVYRNTLPDACPGLGFEQRFSYETSLNQLCSTDIITVLHSPPVPRGASCGLGPFQPVTLAR